MDLTIPVTGKEPAKGFDYRPYPVNAGSAPDWPCFRGLPPTPAWGDAPNPRIFMGFGADGPKKRAGCGVHPRSAKPSACLNRIGTQRNVRLRL